MNIKDLPQWAQKLAEEDRAMVDQQQEALDKVEPAIRALADHQDLDQLTLPHRRTIMEILRWSEEDFDKFLSPEPIVNEQEIVLGNGEKKMYKSETPPMAIEDRVERTFAPPHAFFYVEVDDKIWQVYTEYDKDVEFRDEEHPEF